MAIKVYRPDKHIIPIKIGDAIFKVAPLTSSQKEDLQVSITKDRGELQEDILKKTKLLFKYSVKGISGVEFATGEPYSLEFDGDILSDQCVEDFMNMECKSELSTVLWSFVSEIRDKAIDPDGNEMKGVEILPPEGVENIKK